MRHAGQYAGWKIMTVKTDVDLSLIIVIVFKTNANNKIVLQFV